MSFDLKTAISSIAPTLATMLGGPLAGTAVTALESAFGLAPGAGADGITKVLQTGQMTPEIVAAVRAADQKHAEIIGQQGLDLQTLNAKHEEAMEQIEQTDRASARTSNSNRDATWWIGASILVTFALIMSAVLYGCYGILTGGITIKDSAVVAAVAGLVGSVVGYVASNAQTFVNFIFGGSLGADKHSASMAAAVQQALAVKS